MPLASHPTTVLFSPSPQYIEQELDVEIVPTQDIKIELTDRAAEVRYGVVLVDHEGKLNGVCYISNFAKSLYGKITLMLLYE